ncbi:thioredoxin domain-containing protein [Actinoplanes sp. N902-109]|uniref:DsbA family protein n=1 Tax=Actinoplanes sp. (strain N902-109) TaxID=649831 RepID=UPI00032963C2|nr:thioredoxin domain-containing protein [Actinoplanes sp. N902-109]AGL14810.1 DSBA oxidoreductase [Actinoplanes sp. N902-109]
MSKATKERTQAKRIVQQQRAKERQRRITIWTSVAVVAVLVIAGLVGWGIAAGQENDKTAGLVTPSVAVDDGTAFAVGTGPVTVDVYEDFMCPHCEEFETAAGSTIDQLVAANKVTVRYHPIAILDGASSTQYSTRSAAASAAAAVGGKFSEYHKALFANQPAEGSAGLDDAKLVELGKSAGLGDDFAKAVDDGTYKAWATKATDTAAARGVTSTPTVRVAGKALDAPTAAALTAAVDAAAG